MISTRNLLQARFEEFGDELNNAILDNGKVVEVEAGEVLIQAGDKIRNTILVIDGRIKIYREDESGKEFLLYYLEPGTACAISIMCAIQDEESKITAVAETDSTYIAIPFDLINKWMHTFPSWNQFVMRTYRNRFDELLLTLDHVAFMNMDERLVFYLEKKMIGNGAEISVSHQEIANDLNTAREVVSRLLKKLEQHGAIQLERNLVRVIDLKKRKEM